MTHRLGLATRTQISVCKSPFPSAGTAVSLFRAKTVQQKPLLPQRSKPGCRIVGSLKFSLKSVDTSECYARKQNCFFSEHSVLMSIHNDKSDEMKVTFCNTHKKLLMTNVHICLRAVG